MACIEHLIFATKIEFDEHQVQLSCKVLLLFFFRLLIAYELSSFVETMSTKEQREKLKYFLCSFSKRKIRIAKKAIIISTWFQCVHACVCHSFGSCLLHRDCHCYRFWPHVPIMYTYITQIFPFTFNFTLFTHQLI